MLTTTSRTTIAILAVLLIPCLQSTVGAQTDPPSDSAKEAEAFKAMEAAADSARKAAEARAARAQRNPMPVDTNPRVLDSVAAEGAAKAVEETVANTVKVLEVLGDAAGKSVPDTTGKTVPDSIPADTTGEQSATTATDTTTRQAEAPPAKPVDPTAPYKDTEFAPDEKPRVVIETSMGRVIVELWPDVARKHCQSFVYQVTNGFYDSLMIHRVVPGFLIQGGDPQGTGAGGPGYSLPAEFTTKYIHEEGTMSMARRVDPEAKTGAAEKPEFLNSAGSQFFICTARASSLDGKYTIFGKVIEGLEIIHNIEKTPAQRERPLSPVYMTKVYLEPKA